jgi:hypothetical protein
MPTLAESRRNRIRYRAKQIMRQSPYWLSPARLRTHVYLSYPSNSAITQANVRNAITNAWYNVTNF